MRHPCAAHAPPRGQARPIRHTADDPTDMSLSVDAALDDAMDAMYRDSGALTGGSKAARVANTALSRTAL